MLALLFGVIACKDRLTPDAIKSVTNSLDHANQLIIERNNLLSQTLDEKTKDPQTANQSIPWELRSRKLRESIGAVIKHIDNLKRKLNKTNDAKKAADLLDKEVSQLYSKLVGFNDRIIEIINAKEFVDNPSLQQQVTADAQKLKQETAFLFGLVADSAATQSVDAVTWKNLNISNTNSLLTQAMLSRLQNDVLIASNKLLTYCYNNTLVINHEYLVFQPLVTMDRSYVKRGEFVDVSVGVGVFSFYVDKITINGKEFSVRNDGMVTYRFIATGKPGTYNVPLTIECSFPNGTRSKRERELSYTIE